MTPAPYRLKLHTKQAIAFQTPATEVLYGGAAGAGKALAIDTPVMTKRGIIPLADIVEGDFVYSPNGLPVEVLAVTDVMHDRPCYALVFDDGSKLVADASHEWLNSLTGEIVTTESIHLMAQRFYVDHRSIVSCNPVPSVPVKCIWVEGSMWLAGESLIPTHNSHLMRVAAIAWCIQNAGLQVYLFRRIREDLIKNHMEGATGFRALLAPFADQVTIVEDEIRFNNGSRIYLCHCKDDKDRFKYLGTEIHVLLIDEVTTFSEVVYRFLRSRVRMPDNIRAKGFPRILCGSNPGNIGHQWVKATWIDPKPAMEAWNTPPEEGGFVRQFIPGRLTDNPSLNTEDYSNTLSGLGNEALVRSMLQGDWDVVAGAAFDIDRNRHMLRSFTPPKHWTKFTSLDWGFVRPYANCWYCVVEGTVLLKGRNGWPDVWLPNGAVVMYRELYGTTGKPNEGSREESPDVVRKIMALEDEAGEVMDYRIADTQIWAKNDGMSIFERMYNTDNRFNPRKSEKDRQAAYNEICTRLRGEEREDGGYTPMFYATENCHHFWRTVPSLVLDESQPEKGPDEKQELHCYDSVQYALMSRPYVTSRDQRIVSEFKRLRAENKLEALDPYRVKPIMGKK